VYGILNQNLTHEHCSQSSSTSNEAKKETVARMYITDWNVLVKGAVCDF